MRLGPDWRAARRSAVDSCAFREALIATAGGLASGSVKASFMYPAALLLEALARRANPDRLRHLSLKIMVDGLYPSVLAEVLENNGYITEEHPIAWCVQLVTGLFTFGAVPFFLAWVIVALAMRRR